MKIKTDEFFYRDFQVEPLRVTALHIFNIYGRLIKNLISDNLKAGDLTID